jgi:hypothetical protein
VFVGGDARRIRAVDADHLVLNAHTNQLEQLGAGDRVGARKSRLQARSIGHLDHTPHSYPALRDVRAGVVEAQPAAFQYASKGLATALVVAGEQHAQRERCPSHAIRLMQN